jgi:endonuclease-3
MATTAETRRFAAKVGRRLAEHYPEATCSLNFQSPLELLVATILSAQCTDVRVNQVTKTLFVKYPTAADFARARIAELEQDIQSTGFFHNKAKSIQACCQALVERFEGEVPRQIDQLVELQGIGRKTANVVLGTAYGVAAGVVVDTHVARLSRRLGLTEEKDPKKIERDLMQLFPQREWIALSHRLIQHGRQYCTALRPKCDTCPFQSLCPRIGVLHGSEGSPPERNKARRASRSPENP